jgi:hypothetical protein
VLLSLSQDLGPPGGILCEQHDFIAVDLTGYVEPEEEFGVASPMRSSLCKDCAAAV